jgi:hypothetical protein
MACFQTTSILLQNYFISFKNYFCQTKLPAKKKTIFIKNLENQTRTFEVAPTILVSDLLTLIQTKDGLPEDLVFHLIFGGKVLQPHLLLSDYDINNFSTLFISIKVVGGMPPPKKKGKGSNTSSNSPSKKGTTLGTPSQNTSITATPTRVTTPVTTATTTTTTITTVTTPSIDISLKDTPSKEKRKAAQQAEVFIEQEMKIKVLEQKITAQGETLNTIQELLFSLVANKKETKEKIDITPKIR